LSITQFLILLFAQTLTLPVAAQPDIRQLFREMPDSLMPYISANSRLDFLDFVDSGMKAEVTNALDGHSQLTAVTADSLSLRMNDCTQLDMMLLTVDGQPVDSCQQVVCLIHTYGCDPTQREAAISFYSTKWRKLTQKPPLTPLDSKKLKPFENLTIINWYERVLNKQ
jgi:hypothetical protein